MLGFFNFDAFLKRIETHEDPEFLHTARELIPLDQINAATQNKFRLKQIEVRHEQSCSTSKKIDDEAVLFESIFLMEILQWFKNDFFHWFYKPECENCKLPCPLKEKVIPHFRLDVDTIEIYACPRCEKIERFYRYNHTPTLLNTKKGRCHEHSQVFALFCKALNYDSRMVYDAVNDHIWNEVYSNIQQRWIHCDPSEAVFDKPLLYEVGWKKQISYAIAIGDGGIQDVTNRYITTEGGRKITDPQFDKALMNAINSYRTKILAGYSATQKNHYLVKIIKELAELMIISSPPKETYQERQSGSLQWRQQRGEHSACLYNLTQNDYIFDVPHVEKFSVLYSSNADAYLVSNPYGRGFTVNNGGWKVYTNGYQNIKRKVEKDWKMSYLAREVCERPGILRWMFKLRPGLCVTRLSILASFFACDTGMCKCVIRSNYNCQSFANDVQGYFHSNIKPSEDEILTVDIELSGGKGENGWQHAQVCRQSINKSDVGFAIILEVKKFCEIREP